MITEQELEMLKQIEAQANPNPWTDFPGNGRSHRTHIGYQANTIDEGGNTVNIAMFETNTNAKRADVLLAVYARNYLAPLLNELTQLRAELATLSWARWVPVSERLPENHDDILLWDYGELSVGWYSEKRKRFMSYKKSGPTNCITHWMPIPPAPKQLSTPDPQ